MSYLWNIVIERMQTILLSVRLIDIGSRRVHEWPLHVTVHLAIGIPIVVHPTGIVLHHHHRVVVVDVVLIIVGHLTGEHIAAVAHHLLLLRHQLLAEIYAGHHLVAIVLLLLLLHEQQLHHLVQGGSHQTRAGVRIYGREIRSQVAHQWRNI